MIVSKGMIRVRERRSVTAVFLVVSFRASKGKNIRIIHDTELIANISMVSLPFGGDLKSKKLTIIASAIRSYAGCLAIWGCAFRVRT